MGRNRVTISPVPITSGTALSHLSHKLIRAASQRKENSVQIGRRITVSAERQEKIADFSTVLEMKWVFRFLRSI